MEEQNPEKSNIIKPVFIGSLVFLIFILLSTFGFNWYLSQTEANQNRIESANMLKIEEAKKLKDLAMKKAEEAKILQTKTIADDTIENHIPASGKFIAADLDNMRLFLYEDASLVKEYPILSKGKPGSFWETPSGDYQILDKAPRHYSSVGEVYMPWSMQFYGNFFIHGWPYYADGSQVPPGYSGGCIRLDTKDSEEVYNFAERSTPIFVYERSDQASSTRVTLKLKNIAPPQLSALSYIVADVNTGEVFLQKNTDTPLPIASLTKLMTAIVSNEVIMFDRKITITPQILETYGESGNLQPGEVLSAIDILYPLLMESSNDAATALSSYYGEKSFVSLMNKKAKALGMKSTVFGDASGISNLNVSTTNDLYLLSKYLKNNKSFILNITKLPEKQITSSVMTHTFHNFNIFSENKNFLGGKTGYTKAADETMLALFEIPIQDKTYNIVFIVLESNSREKDVRALLDWFEQAAS